MEYLQVIGLVLTAITGTSGGGIFGYLLCRRKQIHQENIELLPHLVKRIDGLEESHARCAREHAESQGKIGRLEEAIRHAAEKADMLGGLKYTIAAMAAGIDRIEKSNKSP